eukprot:gene50892-62244_t
MKAIGFIAALLAATAVQAQEPITLKVHHFWPPGAMPPTQILAPWCDRIAADSGQRLKCQVYPAMQLGGTPAQLIDQVKDGVVDIAFTLPGYTAGRFPIMEVFELPFMTNSAEAASRAAWDFYGKYAGKEFPGIKPLMFATHDEGYLHTRERQIKTLADFKGFAGEAMSMGERTPLAVVNAAASGRMAVAEAITNLLAAPIELPRVK